MSNAPQHGPFPRLPLQTSSALSSKPTWQAASTAASSRVFRPEPNGYLHVGHAKSICLNFGLAQDYQGKCNLRFDDTNPEKESEEYAQSIQEDVRWLGFQWDGEVRWASDYFERLYQFAVELINKGLAYVDDLTPEQMREYRGTLTQPAGTARTATAVWRRISTCSRA